MQVRGLRRIQKELLSVTACTEQWLWENDADSKGEGVVEKVNEREGEREGGE